MTDRFSKNPLSSEGVQRSEGHEETKQNVRQRQIRDEEVRDGLHGLVRVDHITDEDVSEESEEKDDGVQHVEDNLHQRMVDYVAVEFFQSGVVWFHLGRSVFGYKPI